MLPANLPPLPEADHVTRTGEVTCGTTLVVGLVAGAITLVATMLSPTASFHNQMLMLAICTEGVVAIGCLAYILCGDAGVIHRTPATTSPIPPEVQERINSGDFAGLQELSNIDGADGRSYCVRCLVWRPGRKWGSGDEESLCCPTMDNGSKCHHCSICNRCVEGFDHHCGVLGRCIAKRNLCAFYTLLMMIPFAIATILVALMLAVPPPGHHDAHHVAQGAPSAYG